MRTFLLVLLLVGATWHAGAVGIGQSAPDFTLPRLDGDGQLSLTDYQGKVVLVDFWASWCGPCRLSLPRYDELYQEFGDQGFVVVAINLDEDLSEAERFMTQYPVSYPMVRDAEGVVPTQYGLTVMPTAWLLDSEGQIVWVHAGFRRGDEEQLREILLPLLSP